MLPLIVHVAADELLAGFLAAAEAKAGAKSKADTINDVPMKRGKVRIHIRLPVPCFV